eukprot:1137046-Pelagomonas_calceolata.AAC.4
MLFAACFVSLSLRAALRKGGQSEGAGKLDSMPVCAQTDFASCCVPAGSPWKSRPVRGCRQGGQHAGLCAH